MSKKLIIFLIFILLIGVVYLIYKNFFLFKTVTKVEKVNFVTKDGVTIVADYYPNEKAKFVGIFIHMKTTTKESYQTLAKFFQKEGFAVLAIDLRGHGESWHSVVGKLNHKQFDPDEEKKIINDIEASSFFLEKEGFDKSKQFLIGASIGANLSYQFLSENQKIKAAVLLSPGFNYSGITVDKVEQENFSEKLLLVYALNDLSTVELAKNLKIWYPNLKVLELQGSEHGTDLLKSYPQLSESILNWLREKLI